MSSLSLVQQIVTDKLQQYEKNRGSTIADAFSKLKKPTLLQDAKIFNEREIDAKKCRTLLQHLIYVINSGEVFTQDESTTLFFQITKLFQTNCDQLRRMVYLIIKELRNDPSIYIITSCITKDMNDKKDLLRMNALRLVPIIADPSNLVQIERYVKNAIVDKNWCISAASLIAGVHLYQGNSEMIKKWTNEVMEKLNSKSNNTHFQALILIHEIKKQDKLLFNKLLISLTKERSNNQLFQIQLIRFVKEVLQGNEFDQNTEKIFIDYLTIQTQKSQDAVVFEACKALCELKNISNKDLQPTVSVLCLFLLSQSSVSKFSALKILNKLILNPLRVNLIQNKEDFETLIQDPNKSLSSMAISLLLKICKPEHIDQLLNQVYDYITEISDEFKIDILRSIRALIKKAAKKFKVYIQLNNSKISYISQSQLLKYRLSLHSYQIVQNLKDHKNSKNNAQVINLYYLIILINNLVTIEQSINEVPDCTEIALFHLVEYIEDCSFNQLHLQVLSVLSTQILKNNINPSRYIRFVNNRITLENAEIRAASISTLGKFGIRFDEVRNQVKSIMKQSFEDADDEVRERALFYYTNLDSANADAVEETEIQEIDLGQIEALEKYIHQNMEKIQNSNDINCLSKSSIQKFKSDNNLQSSNTANQPQQYDPLNDDYENDNVQQNVIYIFLIIKLFDPQQLK